MTMLMCSGLYIHCMYMCVALEDTLPLPVVSENICMLLVFQSRFNCHTGYSEELDWVKMKMKAREELVPWERRPRGDLIT